MTTQDLVARSIDIILDGQAPNGPFIAGPTFSQYGYAWLRDGAFIAESLGLVGRHEAAGRFHAWVADIICNSASGIERSIEAGRAGRLPDPSDYLHCRYRADGSVGPDDWPTFQLDGPGLWLWSVGRHVALSGESLEGRVAQAAVLAGRYLAALWPLPSNDAWEESPEQVHTSTVAADMAGLRALLELSDDARADQAIVAAESAMSRRLRNQGAGSAAWTKWDGNDAVDASLLWIAAPFGLVGPTDARFAATLGRVEKELVSVDGGVHRYAADTYYGGGEWLLLTAALGRVYARRNGPGDRDRAVRCLHWIAAQAAPDGSLPEQVAGRALHPSYVAGWRSSWGESASPLLWSHAAYLALATELGRR